ncbi:MAG: hypothetical protein ACJAWI_002737 [Marinomonas primoryensis]
MDIIPKFSDVKHLSDLAKVFALPMLAVAYILQTGVVLDFDGYFSFGIHNELSENQALARFILIIILKAIWVSCFGSLAYALIAFVHIMGSEIVVPLCASIFFVFALIGFFDIPIPQEAPKIEKFWSYCFLVWGFFY